MINLANLLTTGNLIFGIIAIILALSGHYMYAPFAIFGGAICDFLDGFAARLFKTQGPFGKQLDSLADMVTFGIAPGVMMMTLLIQLGSLELDGRFISVHHWVQSLKSTNPLVSSNYLPFIALLIPIFSMFRLAKFNLDDDQSEHFKGLPTPAMTLFFCTFPLVILMSDKTGLWLLSDVMNSGVLSGLIVVIGSLMIIPFRLFSLKFKSFGLAGNEIRYVFLLISLGLILLFHEWSIALIVFLYLILSLIENAIIRAKK